MSSRDALTLEWIVLAHLVAGFLLPTHLLARRGLVGDEERPWSGLLSHTAGVAVCFLPFAIAFGVPGLAFAVLATISHPLIDLARRLTDRRLTASGTKWVPTLALALLFEQLAHLAILIGGWWILLVGTAPVPAVSAGVDALVAGRDPVAFHRGVEVFVVLSALLIANTVVASRVIGLVVPSDVHETPEPEAHEELTTGESGATMAAAVGILERFLVVAFVLAHVDVAAVLILATKELSRRQRIERDPRFAERYLIGTFSSFAFAVATAYLARFALGI